MCVCVSLSSSSNVRNNVARHLLIAFVHFSFPAVVSVITLDERGIVVVDDDDKVEAGEEEEEEEEENVAE